MSGAADLNILGGGPAGAAAAIAAHQRGLRAVLIETLNGPDPGPGETIHPGAAAIFRQLGVLEEIEAVSTLRPEAHLVRWGEELRRSNYGDDEHGPWRGYQLPRADLNRILLQRFEDLGGKIVRSAGPLRPMAENGIVRGVRMPDRELAAAFTIDATGRHGLLRRALGIGQRRASPPLVAQFGYRQGYFGPEPTISGNADGWSWTAQIGDDLIAWVRIDARGRRGRLSPPDVVGDLPATGQTGARDVTWRMSETVAGPGYFLVGDAALVLDPAASHGVLRAMMSGMMAAHNAAEALSGAITPTQAIAAYSGWIAAWFERDVAAMTDLYKTLGVHWAAPETSFKPRKMRGSKHV
jgi:flavin-dependent dehydrogenase